MTYTQKVGDRVMWMGGGPYTVTAVGKQRAFIESVGGGEYGAGLGANKRSVWTIATKPFAGAHFAKQASGVLVGRA